MEGGGKQIHLRALAGILTVVLGRAFILIGLKGRTVLGCCLGVGEAGATAGFATVFGIDLLLRVDAWDAEVEDCVGGERETSKSSNKTRYSPLLSFFHLSTWFWNFLRLRVLLLPKYRELVSQSLCNPRVFLFKAVKPPGFDWMSVASLIFSSRVRLSLSRLIKESAVLLSPDGAVARGSWYSSTSSSKSSRSSRLEIVDAVVIMRR